MDADREMQHSFSTPCSAPPRGKVPSEFGVSPSKLDQASMDNENLKRLEDFETYFMELQSKEVIPYHEENVFKGYSDEERDLFKQYNVKKREIFDDFQKQAKSKLKKSMLKSVGGIIPLPISSNLTMKPYLIATNFSREPVLKNVNPAKRRDLEKMKTRQDIPKPQNSVISDNVGNEDSFVTPVVSTPTSPLRASRAIGMQKLYLDGEEERPNIVKRAPSGHQTTDNDDLFARKGQLHENFPEKKLEMISHPTDNTADIRSQKSLQQNSKNGNGSTHHFLTMLHEKELQKCAPGRHQLETGKRLQRSLPQKNCLETGITSGVADLRSSSFRSNICAEFKMPPANTRASIESRRLNDSVGIMETELNSSYSPSNVSPATAMTPDLPPPLVLLEIAPWSGGLGIDIKKTMTLAEQDASRITSAGTTHQEKLGKSSKHQVNPLPKMGNPVETEIPFQVCTGKISRTETRQRKSRKAQEDMESDIRRNTNPFCKKDVLNNVPLRRNSSSAFDSMRVPQPPPLILRRDRKQPIDRCTSDEKKQKIMLRGRQLYQAKR